MDTCGTSVNNERDETIILNVSVIFIRFRASDSGFRIISVRDEDNNIFSVKGVLGEIVPGSNIKIYGTWGAPYKGEPQFQCVFFEEIRPSKTNEIISFLSAGAFPGIGPFIAKRIVEHFGDKTFDILDNDPDRLAEVRGIGEKKKERIKNGWEKQKAIRIIGRHLLGLGISPGLIERIYKQFGDDAVSVIKSNPYKLCELKGIGFMTADKIAMKNGFRKDSHYRVISGIKYIIEKECAFGHTYAVFSAVIRKSIGILGVKEEIIVNGIFELCKQKKTIYENKALYPRSLYLAEKGTAAKLKILSSAKPFPCNVMPIEDIEESVGIHYDELQASAIAYAARESVFIITGGPGTGKSAILSGILLQFKESGLTVKLAAPTGRAAKHMTEVTGIEAATIHRLLYSLESESSAEMPAYINADVVIIDETSMVDISMMNWLLSHIQERTRLIMLGDADQLPSVGPGTVLRDMIRSRKFRTIKLQKIFRQDDHSTITKNAKMINNGEKGLIVNHPGCGFYFLNTDKGAEYIEDKIADIVTRQIPEHYGFSIDDIQVLSPVRKAEYSASTTKLNQKIREAVNPLKDNMVEVHNLRENDRVMNIQNDYVRNVFNGDTGTVASIDMEDKTVTIDFDGNIVEYDFDEIEDSIVLCYAITIHKAQGSEYPVVVMPITMSHRNMLQRTLLYTAVTRAQKMIVLVGEPSAVNRAIQNTSVDERRGRLYERLLS